MTDTPSSILDAHVHLWDTSRFELPWLAGVPELNHRYTARDLRAAIGEAPVAAAVAVQAGETAEEAAWLFDAASEVQHGGLSSRVVLQHAPAASGWLGTVHSVVDGLGILPAGVRLPIHRRAADWTDLEGLDTLLGGLEQRGLVLELLLRPDQIPVIHELAAAHPRLDIVLCHLGLSTAESRPEWRTALKMLTSRSNVSAKVSGLFSPQGTAADADSRARDAIAQAADALGPDRLMFGSDWPMSTRAGTYADVVERTALILPALTSEESAAIWRETAERIYGIADSR
jgi:L-fuconolactonase